MKNVYKISLLLFILLISVSFVSAADNSTQHTDVTANKISHTDKSIVTNDNPNTITKTDDNITTTKKVKTVQNKQQQTKNIKTKTNSKKNVKIIANNVNAKSGQNVTFTGRVVDNKNKNVTTGNVVVKINGKTVAKTTIKDKKFTAKYTIPSNYSAKNYKLQYVYVQNSKYNRYELNKTLTLTKPLTNVKITANNVNSNSGKTVTFTGKVVDNKNKVVTTGNVLVKINYNTVAKTAIKDKKFTVKYTIPSSYSAKNYKLQYIYVQNKQYNRYELNRTLTVTKPLTNVKITANNVNSNPGKTVTFTGNVVDNHNKTVTTGNVVIKINGKTAVKTSIKDKKFTAKYTIPSNYSAKNYKLQYVYVQNSKYNRYELNRTLTLNRRNVVMYASEVNAHVGDNVNFNGLLVDSDKKLVQNGKVQIKINGKTIGTTDIKNNTFSYNYTIPKSYSINNSKLQYKEYHLQYIYLQNNMYKGCILNRSLYIVSDNRKIMTTKADCSIKTNMDGTIKVNGTVLVNNKPVTTKEVSVLLKLDNKVFGSTTVGKDGKFSHIIEATSDELPYEIYPGTHIITLLTAIGGNKLENEFIEQFDLYKPVIVENPSNSKNNVIIKTEINNTQIYANQKVTLSGHVEDTEGEPVTNGVIILKNNGNYNSMMNWQKGQIFYKTSLDSNGNFEFTLNMPGKLGDKYDIQYVYLENDKYKRSTLDRTIRIMGNNTFYVISGKTNYINLDIDSIEDFNLTIKINGTEYKNHNNKTFKIHANPGVITVPLFIPKNYKVGTEIPITFTIRFDYHNIDYNITRYAHILGENKLYNGTIKLVTTSSFNPADIDPTYNEYTYINIQ